MIDINKKEFTFLEYREFIERHNLESFSKSQIDAFSIDVLEKSKKGELDEYELACATADYASLHPVIVVREDLTKSIMYWREAQTESVDNIPDGIFKSIDDNACRKFKITPLNILKGIAGINCADTDAIEKARKGEPIGAIKTWAGKEYVKTPNGWRPKGKDKKSSDTESKDSKKTKLSYDSVKEDLMSFLENREREYYENDNGVLYYDEIARDFCKEHEGCDKDSVRKFLKKLIWEEEVKGKDAIFWGKRPDNALEIFKLHEEERKAALKNSAKENKLSSDENKK